MKNILWVADSTHNTVLLSPWDVVHYLKDSGVFEQELYWHASLIISEADDLRLTAYMYFLGHASSVIFPLCTVAWCRYAVHIFFCCKYCCVIVVLGEVGRGSGVGEAGGMILKFT